MSNTDEEGQPLWLSGDHDHIIQKTLAEDEAQPLFGSGKLPLEEEAKDDVSSWEKTGDGDVESHHSNYGSIKDNKAAVDGSSPAPSSSSKSGIAKKKKTKKVKKNPPPKSIFDEEPSEESSNISDDSRTALTTLSSKPHMPHRNWCLEFFRSVSGVTVVSSLGLLATQIIPLFVAPFKEQGYFDLALKVYISLFCLLFILVEFDAPVPFIRNSQLLQSYLSRGFIYSFLGLICLEEAYSERVKEIVKLHADEFHVAWASLFMQISSWLIFACGVNYMCMGCCCLKKYRDKIRKKDKELWKKYRKEMKKWKRLNT